MMQTDAHAQRRFTLYRLDFELAKSPWAVLIVIQWFLAGALASTLPAVTFGFDWVGSAGYVSLLPLAGIFGVVAWVSYLVNGGSWLNWIEFNEGGITISVQGRYNRLQITRGEIERLEPYTYRAGFDWWLLPMVLTPSPFSKRWVIPPTGGYDLKLQEGKLVYPPFPWRPQHLYFAPRNDDEFGDYLRNWLTQH